MRKAWKVLLKVTLSMLRRWTSSYSPLYWPMRPMAMPSPPLKTQSLVVMSVLLPVVAIVHGPVQWEREISEERMVLRAVCAVLAVSRAPVELTASRRELFRVMGGMGPY